MKKLITILLCFTLCLIQPLTCFAEGKRTSPTMFVQATGDYFLVTRQSTLYSVTDDRIDTMVNSDLSIFCYSLVDNECYSEYYTAFDDVDEETGFPLVHINGKEPTEVTDMMSIINDSSDSVFDQLDFDHMSFDINVYVMNESVRFIQFVDDVNVSNLPLIDESIASTSDYNYSLIRGDSGELDTLMFAMSVKGVDGNTYEYQSLLTVEPIKENRYQFICDYTYYPDQNGTINEDTDLSDYVDIEYINDCDTGCGNDCTPDDDCDDTEYQETSGCTCG